MSSPSTAGIITQALFDWDGNFANTEKISTEITRRVLTDYANSVFKNPMEDLIGRLEMRGKDFGQIAQQFQDVVNRQFDADHQVNLDIEDLRINKLRPLMRDAILDVSLAPHIIEAITELQDQDNIGVAIVSNSPRMRIQPVLDKHALQARIPAGHLFSAFEDVAKLKEDPAIYLLAVDKLQVSAQNAVAIEDSRTGMMAATSANIGLRVGYTGLVEGGLDARAKQTEDLFKAGAHIVISDMGFLPAVIRDHNRQFKL